MERNTGLNFFLGFVVGMNIVNLAYITTDRTDEKVLEAQQVNAQIYEELNTGDVTPENLVIELDGQTFTYDENGINERTEKCDGAYETDDDQAKVVGSVVCTQTTEVNLGD